ncbi:MAG: tRNA (guanosine(37)-N1)-methyltransferase TrmD [Phycisphaerae bacterium]|nr:tRNA (guanosine(37)-N1)-methyltransferase TrmD [Phycisphaerae bacterium]
MRIDVLTLFPEVFEPFFSSSIIGRARSAGQVVIDCHNIRDYSSDPHRKVDDRPYGGGPGMVLQCQPVFDSVAAVERMSAAPAHRVVLTPRGERLTEVLVRRLSHEPRLLLIAGHYEGFDERIFLGLRPHEISIGDFVLSGGEAAAMVLVDAVVRLLPGVLGADDALHEESFADGLLEYPQYTRPREYADMSVPDVLLAGDHGKIAEWRRAAALELTKKRRPDLLERGGTEMVAG